MKKESLRMQLNDRISELETIIEIYGKEIQDYQEKISAAKRLIGDINSGLNGLERLKSYDSDYVISEITSLNEIKREAEKEIRNIEKLVTESEAGKSEAVNEKIQIKMGMRNLDNLNIDEMKGRLNEILY